MSRHRLALFVPPRARYSLVSFVSPRPRYRLILFVLRPARLIHLTVLVCASPYAAINHRLMNRFLAAVTNTLSRLVTSAAGANAVACTLVGCVGEGRRGEPMMVTFVTKRPQKISTHLFPHALTATHESSASILNPMISILMESEQWFSTLSVKLEDQVEIWFHYGSEYK